MRLFFPLLLAALTTVLNGTLSAAAKPVYLDGPKVVKMDWGTSSLHSADIDGDGRIDLVMIDNDTGKIEILYQNNPDNPKHKTRKEIKRNRWEPVLEDAPFWHDDITMDQVSYDLALGDLNGDGRVDIACTGNTNPLSIRYQDASGAWDKSWTYENISPLGDNGSMQIADIDGDGRNDLIILTDKEVLVFYQDASGAMKEPKRYRTSATQTGNLLIVDINGDNKPDILYLCGSSKYRRVSARMQQAPGTFGPEIGFPLPQGSSNLAIAYRKPRPVFLAINGMIGTIITFTLEESKEAPTSLNTAQLRDYATGTTAKQGTMYAWGDYDGDGDTDIAVANPASAEILLFRQNANGDYEEGKPYPSFSKISSIATLHTKGAADRILVTSSGEEVAGIVEYTKEGRLSFPAPLPVEGKAVSICAGNFDASGTESIALVEKRNEDYFLTNLGCDKEGNWQKTSSTKINNVKRKPEGLLPVAIGPKGSDVLLVFAIKEAARFYVMNEGAFKEIAVDSSVRLGCTSGTDATRINVCDVDEDGRNELLVGTTGYARALRLTDKNDLVVVDQYNSNNPNADIKGPLMIRFNGTDQRQLLLFNDTDDKVEMLVRDKTDGVYRTAETLDSDSQTGFSRMSLIAMGKGRKEAVLATGQERFGILPFDKGGWKLKQTRPAYESELKTVGYSNLATGDLNGDGTTEIVAVDGSENLLDILEEGKNENYESVMHFVVFDANVHADTRQSVFEPREILVADLNHDGQEDVALLVHDRVLIYTADAIVAPKNSETKK